LTGPPAAGRASSAPVSYYGAYRDEIDELIADNEREAAEAHAAFQAGQAALARHTRASKISPTRKSGSDRRTTRRTTP